MLPLIGITVSNAARAAGHGISLAITGVMMGGLIGFLANQSKKRTGSFWNRFGPTILLTFAACLILADVTRHVLQDANLAGSYDSDTPGKYDGGWDGMLQYVKPCWTTSGCCSSGDSEARLNPKTKGGTIEKMHCLSTVGILFTEVFTYVGFALLAFATMWNADLIGKLKEIRDKFREIRAKARVADE